MPIPKLASLFPALALLSTVFTSEAAVVSGPGGAPANNGDPVTGVSDWTIDLGFRVPSLPSTTNRVLFEAGGDGTGVALVLIGNDLIVYQDNGGINNSTPNVDAWFSIDISSLSNQTISARFDADLATANDSISLSVFNGTTTLSNSFTYPINIANIAGGDNSAVGGVAESIAGLGESIEAGFPDMAQFTAASYNSDTNEPLGANVLGGDRLWGTLYTTLADQPPAQIPDPASWPFTVPEPSSAILSMSGLMFLSLRRRRVRA